MEKKLDEVEQGLLQDLQEKTVADLEATPEELEAEYKAFSRQFEEVGKAWPIPYFPLAIQGEPEAAPEEPDEYIEVDDFPVDTHRKRDQLVEKIYRKPPEEIIQGASMHFAQILAAEPGHVLRLDELGEFIYGDPEHSRHVSSLISSYNSGRTKIIGEILRGEGLVLQKGLRRIYLKGTNERTGSAHPVFRAVPAEEEVDWEDDEWYTIVYVESGSQHNAAVAVQATGGDSAAVPPRMQNLN